MPRSTIIPVAVLGIVLAGPAMAQDGATPPAATPDAIGKPAAGAKTNAPLFIPEQTRDHVLAKSLIGANVIDVSGNEVGTVKDLIIDKRGNAVGIIVSWGGVLGIGGKAVAISFGPAQVHDGEKPETKLVRLNVTKDAIEAAPEFMDAVDQEAEAARANRSSGTSQ
jgi:hypothetical protein